MIDWNFIASLEGFSARGYVPEPEKSQSGVTIGGGVDLGQLNEARLKSLNLPETTYVKLAPYLGFKGEPALRLLTQKPLVLTREEALDVTRGLEEEFEEALRFMYGDTWDQLSGEMQTIVASVAFQYGHLPSRTPRFFAATKANDVLATIAELKHFRDAYGTRRHREAAYLEKHRPTTAA